uniref:SAM domain-containing protein n=1 Tax=Lutzomyia longipalpis TaxID=7200 RepID=A0A1B0GJA4_LUTLO
MAYHPCPESDYTDSDSEFDFAFPKTSAPHQVPQKSALEIFLDTLESALRNGDLDVVRKSFESQEFKFDLNEAFPQSGWTPLQTAAHAGSVASVGFLLDRGADATLTHDALTPLITACMSRCEDAGAVREIVEMLLDHGASPTATDRYGFTPLMHACQGGYVPVIEKLLQHGDPDAIDSSGRTALFHAIESNNRDAVVCLLAHGVCKDVVDFKGFTPRSLAEFCGHADILEVIPRGRGTFDIPTCYLTYSKIQDIVPDLTDGSRIPAYFPDLKTILFGMECDHLLPIFALNKINLEEFLSLTDDGLQQLGIRLPFVRKRILRGLFLFHMREWAKGCVPNARKDEKIDLFDLFRQAASHLKHLVILKSTLNHIHNMQQINFHPPTQQAVASCRYALHQLIQQVGSLQDRISYIQSFNPKPILNIDMEALHRSRVCERRKKFLLYSAIAVITVIVIRRVRHH